MCLGGDRDDTALPLGLADVKSPSFMGAFCQLLGVTILDSDWNSLEVGHAHSVFAGKSRPHPQLLAFWCLPCVVIAAGAPHFLSRPLWPRLAPAGECLVPSIS